MPTKINNFLAYNLVFILVHICTIMCIYVHFNIIVPLLMLYTSYQAKNKILNCLYMYIHVYLTNSCSCTTCKVWKSQKCLLKHHSLGPIVLHVLDLTLVLLFSKCFRFKGYLCCKFAKNVSNVKKQLWHIFKRWCFYWGTQV